MDKTTPSPFGLGAISPSNPSGVAVGVAVGVFVGVTVGVAVGVGVAHEPLMFNEKARTEPVSPPALSLAFSVHVPFGFCPSNADNRLFGRNVPVSGPASVVAPH